MNVGVYLSWQDLKTYLDISDLIDDRHLAQFTVGASQLFDLLTHRHFYPIRATYYYDDPETPNSRYYSPLARFSPRLRFPVTKTYNTLHLNRDLLEVVSLTTNNGATTITSSEYYLLSADDNNRTPYNQLDLVEGSGAAFTYSSTPQRANALTGFWGYHQDWSGAWFNTGFTVNDNPLSSSATTMALTGTGLSNIYGETITLKPQQLIRFGTGTSAEYAYLTVVSALASIQLIRGVNGTTAAQQAQGTAVYLYQPLPDVVEIIKTWGTFLFNIRKSPFGVGGTADLGQREIANLLGASLTQMALRYEKRTVNG